jgi:hypothetical protein
MAPMPKTSRAFASLPARRSVIWVFAATSSIVLVATAGCLAEDPILEDGGGAVSGSGATGGSGSGGVMGSGGAGGSAGSGVTTGGSAGTTGGGSGVGGVSAGTGGVVAGSGGTSAGSAGSSSGGAGASSGGASSGGVGGTGGACVDVEPPPDPEWPGATCQTWATETTECSAAWFATYCDAS